MHSYKSVKTAPLYAIPTPSLNFSPWLAMRFSAWNGVNVGMAWSSLTFRLRAKKCRHLTPNEQMPEPRVLFGH